MGQVFFWQVFPELSTSGDWKNQGRQNRIIYLQDFVTEERNLKPEKTKRKNIV